MFVSLTSGEPTPEIVDALRDAGGVPVLRGTVEAFTAIAAVAALGGRPRPAPAARTAPSRAGPRSLPNERSLGTIQQSVLNAASREHGPSRERESLDRLASAGIAGPPERGRRDARGRGRGRSNDSAAPIGPQARCGRGSPTSRISAASGWGSPVPTRFGRAAGDLLALPLPPGARRRGLLVEPPARGSGADRRRPARSAVRTDRRSSGWAASSPRPSTTLPSDSRRSTPTRRRTCWTVSAAVAPWRAPRVAGDRSRGRRRCDRRPGPRRWPTTRH